MNAEKKHQYAGVLLQAYNSGVLKIVWNTAGFSLGVDPKRKEEIPELKEQKFIDYAFSVIKSVMDLAEDKELSENEEKDIEVAKKIYSQESDLKSHLYIKRNSKVNCFKLLESQIISYRNEENPKEIETSSSIIRITTEKDDEDVSYSFEISKRDLSAVIEHLIDLKEKMDSIE